MHSGTLKTFLKERARSINEGVDRDRFVHDVSLYIVNDGDLYKQFTSQIIKTLARFKKQGVYDEDRAHAAYTNLAKRGLKKYNNEVDREHRYEGLSKDDFLALATDLTNYYDDQVDALLD